MEPISIAVICAVAFGGVVALSVFVRQLLLSRDKKLNDEAQARALNQEAKQLEQLRDQIQTSIRLDSHYKLLGENKEAIAQLDKQIEEKFQEKLALTTRFTEITMTEMKSMSTIGTDEQRKKIWDDIKSEMDKLVATCDDSVKELRKRRKGLYKTQQELETYVLEQEDKKNDDLRKLYEKHTELLQKIYFRHTDNTEVIARDTIQAGNYSIKMLVFSPIKFLMQYFSLSTNIDSEQARKERDRRQDVMNMEYELNGEDEDYDNTDTDVMRRKRSSAASPQEPLEEEDFDFARRGLAVI